MADLCYLCLQDILEGATRDHVPAQQFFAPRLRASENLSQLVTLPAHLGCNKAYELDEEYFAWSLVPLALESTAGHALVLDHAAKLAKGKSVGLAFKTLKEFEQNPSGLHLPPPLVLKRIEGARIVRVAWKIVRGLYRIETGRLLPDDTLFAFEMFSPREGPQSAENLLWEEVKAQDSKGAYGAIFAYKYLVADYEGTRSHAWGMLFWNRVMMFILHHDPPAT